MKKVDILYIQFLGFVKKVMQYYNGRGSVNAANLFLLKSILVIMCFYIAYISENQTEAIHE